MRAAKVLFWLTPLLVLAMLLAGCGASPTQVAQQDGGFLLALPRLTVDIDSQGKPSMAGLSPEQLKSLSFGQLDLTGFQLPKEYVAWFTATGLQHIELVHRDDGIHIFANGKAMPHVGWSAESLAKTSEMASALGLLDQRTAKLLKVFIPFAQRLGLDIALTFPLKEGAEAMPLRDPKAPVAAVAEAAEPMAQMKAHVTYDDNGVPSILSVSTRDLEEAFGVSMRQVEMPPAFLAQMQASNIQHISVRATPAGLMLYVNGDALPSFVWNDEYLNNAADLYGQLYYTDAYGPLRNAMKVILPMLDKVDGEVVLKFPTAAGAEEIPLPQP